MRLPSAWSGPARSFLSLDPAAIASDRLQAAIPVLQQAIGRQACTDAWWLALDLRLLRLGSRIDAVLATDRAVLAVLARPGALAFTAADRRAAEDAALDLADFHQGSLFLPILPVLLIPNGARVRQQFPLPLAGAAPVIEATRLTLPGLLEQVARFPALGRDGAAWAEADYAPVAGLLDAACSLYAAHGVEALRLASAGPAGLRRTQAAVASALADARTRDAKTIVFVTGAPGAGKTLCGLDLAFAPGQGAAFLTGNPTLVQVLREALVRDAGARGADRHAARRRMAAVIQALPQFRDASVASGAAPAERVLIVDEAQRCWSRGHAIGKTRNRAVPLSDSEPGHLLDIMARRPGWAALVCLVGGGQEIHDGEAGLAGWGEALARRPGWRVHAPAAPQGDPRQRLPDLPGCTIDADLHLAQPIRAVHTPQAAAWVEAMLADAPGRAAEIAGGGTPFAVTRSLAAMRAALRPRGSRTAGLLASSTARRLRAEGLGAVLPHQDEDAVARWFLDRWPDIRSGDALELVATEFAVQGLELDRAGLCWDADLVRAACGWEARRFRGTAWTRASAEARSNRINAYRVLLTRARHGTVIWVPRGDPRDPTRDPARYDAVAAYLLACGAAPLDAAARLVEDAPAQREPGLI